MNQVRMAVMASVFALLLVGCETGRDLPEYGAAPKTQQKTAAEDAQQQVIALDDAADAALARRDPVLGQGDEIAVQVYRHGDLSRQFVIPPSGRIFFPMVGDVDTTGMTVAQLQEKLTEGLAGYVKDPQVNVQVTQSRSQGFLVLGEVANPGQYSSPALVKALEAIGRAGGFTQEASHRVILIRESPSGANAHVLDLKKLLTKGELQHNIALRGGDVLYVPPSGLAKFGRGTDHVHRWLAPIIGLESAIILGDEINQRLIEGEDDTDIVIGP